MLWYFDLFSQKSWFSKTNNCSFCNKTTQDFAEFWEIWVNFKAKTKTEDERILRKGKRSSSWFFSLHIGLAEREENQIFCYAKHATKTLMLTKIAKGKWLLPVLPKTKKWIMFWFFRRPFFASQKSFVILCLSGSFKCTTNLSPDAVT